MTGRTEAHLISRYRSELMGIAMLWVMLFHCFLVSIDQPLLKAVKEIGFCGVDIFIVMSGMGQYVSLAKNGRLKDYYFRRLLRILPAYWLVVGVYGLVLRLLQRTSLTMVALNLSTLQYWLGVSGGFNWYVPALLVFYLLAPFYARLLRRCRSGMLLTLCSFPISFMLSELVVRMGAVYLADFLYRLPAFAVGCLLGRHLTEDRADEDRALLWGGLGAFGLLLAYVRVKGLYYISYCYIVTAVMVPLCVLLCLVLRRLPGAVSRFLRLMGTYSLEIYLVNVIITVEVEGLSRWLSFGLGYGVYYLVGFLITIPLALVLHRALEPVIQRLEGWRRDRRMA